MLRRAYDWCIASADKPHALWLMGLMSFLESSVFPVPPDAMLIPMSVARPEREVAGLIHHRDDVRGKLAVDVLQGDVRVAGQLRPQPV